MKQISPQDLEKLNHHKQVLFACFCAEQVFHLVQEKYKKVCKQAIDIAYLFLEGKASKEECRIAANAAADADAAHAVYAAANAAYAAAHAVYAVYAAYAAYAAAAANAAKLPIIEAQWAFYDQLLNGDKYFEEIILKS